MDSSSGASELKEEDWDEGNSSSHIWTPEHFPISDNGMPSADRESLSVDRINVDWLVEPFQSVDLQQLNAKADMLKRLDNKYIIRQDILHEAVEEFVTRFDILQIGGKRVFVYDTCYFDDLKNSIYFDHLRGRRQRFKVRVRKYNDSEMCFVEMKLKDKRGVTIKKRLNYSVEKYGHLDGGAWKHIVSSYQDMYGREFSYILEPVLEMRYKRVTLVAKEGGERMTIDFQWSFSAKGRSNWVDDDVFIVETKSSNANGIADKILRRLHQHPIKSCSKYCVARAALQDVSQHNRFLPALRKLNILRKASRVAAPSASSFPCFSSAVLDGSYAN